MCVPINPGGGTIGVIYVDSLMKSDCFRPDDLALLRAIANMAAVAIESAALRGGEPKGRWALTFAFGLIHGFGFASVLRELGVGRDGVGLLLPLFTFNLGVEIGQVAVAAVVLPLIWRLRKNEMFLRRGVPALSAAVALAGTYWLLERTLSG